ncbi:processed acidic surface protein [Oceanobacillus timonensis]|uniref:processed acidic surface protein n=1 Tax=Oceanobacillus timonensis TaxID=1926285 RepID=UPI0009B9ACEA|nr:processed acidic surface protein [Oceanobacillus timonensis]
MKKKLLSICFALILTVGFLPSHAFALEADDPEVEAFLESIDWEVDDYEDHLEEYDYSLADFDDVTELGTPTTEEALDELLDEHDLTYDELDEQFREEELLLEDEEIMDSMVFMFIENVEIFIDLISTDDSGGPEAGSEDAFGSMEEEITDENLEALAQDYGFESIEELEEVFAAYEDSINNYTTLFEVENAAEYYVSTDESSDSEIDLEEEADSGQEEDIWNTNTDITADMFDTSFLTDDPVIDIYTMISIVITEALMDL